MALQQQLHPQQAIDIRLRQNPERQDNLNERYHHPAAVPVSVLAVLVQEVTDDLVLVPLVDEVHLGFLVFKVCVLEIEVYKEARRPGGEWK